MKVPSGKTVYIGAKKYQAGAEIPDELAGRLEKPETSRPARIPKPKPPAEKKPPE